MSTLTRMETSERMSKVVIHNDTVYLCGQVGADKGEQISMAKQTENMLAKVDSLLEQAGSSRELMLSATIYVRDINDFAEMNEIWDSWVPAGHAPARACVEARMARPDLLVEISVVAAAKKYQDQQR